ncbi:hypothetical protein IGI04_012932 [Brassica rapa subsp. trilocularis]|uniref:Uncharacterized protein n=1 Tax=Brassica rapa subsp. trilocularis TaxID=1813537 RepID=A0ABQ7N803_BRACM|nr:hypothetical protein IGI04_012932 [Brassica rapa subsp. trilocularis]
MPDECDSAAWFTNLTGRFVRLVRNLDVLERVYTMETQIMQIKDAIGIQNNRVVVVNVSVDDEQRPKSSESTESMAVLGNIQRQEQFL